MKCLYSRHKVALYSMPTMIKGRQAGALVLLQFSYLSGQPIRPCSFPIIELFCHVWMIHRIEPFVACSSCTCGPPKIARDGKRCPVLLPVFYVIFITVLSLIHKGNRPPRIFIVCLDCVDKAKADVEESHGGHHHQGAVLHCSSNNIIKMYYILDNLSIYM